MLSAASVFTLGIVANWFAAAFLAFTIFFYVVVYTMWLKRSTPQNIVIGGAAGAFPPMVAYAAATGSASWSSFALFALIFVWTPPHFWALAWVKSEEFAQGQHPDAAQRRRPPPARVATSCSTAWLSLPSACSHRSWASRRSPTAYSRLRSVSASSCWPIAAGASARVRRPTRRPWRYSRSPIPYLFLLFAEIIGERTLMLAKVIPWL